MGRTDLMKKLVLPIMMIGGTIAAHSQEYVEVDPKLAAYVMTNTAYANVTEASRNRTIEKQRKVQDSIQVKTLTLATIKEVATMSYENIKYFSFESQTYLKVKDYLFKIANNTVAICGHLEDVRTDISVLMEVWKIMGRVKNLAQAYSDIVCGGQVDILGEGNGKSDKKNWLNPANRINMAHHILVQLAGINRHLEIILMRAKYLTLKDTLMFLDAGTFIRALGARAIMEYVVWDWRNFRHRL